jgi:hypothetical protein
MKPGIPNPAAEPRQGRREAVDLMDDNHGRTDCAGRQHRLCLAEKLDIAPRKIVDVGTKLGHLDTSRKLPHSFIVSDVGLLSSRR